MFVVLFLGVAVVLTVFLVPVLVRAATRGPARRWRGIDWSQGTNEQESSTKTAREDSTDAPS